jgi:hypothetical protein
MLYCGGFLIDRNKDCNGNSLGPNIDNRLTWVNMGRRALTACGKRDLQKSRKTSSMGKLMAPEFIPIFLRTEADLVSFKTNE